MSYYICVYIYREREESIQSVCVFAYVYREYPVYTVYGAYKVFLLSYNLYTRGMISFLILSPSPQS